MGANVALAVHNIAQWGQKRKCMAFEPGAGGESRAGAFLGGALYKPAGLCYNLPAIE
jgi:hypothetical protein